MADLFDYEIRLTDAITGKATSVNVSKETKELYEILLNYIQNKDDLMTESLNKFLLNFSGDVLKNGLYNGNMIGNIFNRI